MYLHDIDHVLCNVLCAHVQEIALELTNLKHNSESHLEEECSTKPEHVSDIILHVYSTV